MTWLRTPSGGYVDPLEVVAVLPSENAEGASDVYLRGQSPDPGYVIDDTPTRTWHAVMDARRAQ